MHPEPLLLYATVCVDKPRLSLSRLYERADQAAAEAARQRAETGAEWAVIRVTVAAAVGGFW